jgi:hypothetical protein
MYGLLIAVGNAARTFHEENISSIWPVRSKAEVVTPIADVTIARFEPMEADRSCGYAWSDDRRVLVCVDGYLYTSTAPRGASGSEQARSLANECRRNGYEAGIRSIAGGTFNLVVVDLVRSRCHVTTDHIGALALYHSPIEGGWLFSTNPVALARSGIVDREPDFTAMAEWAYIGYTIGDRFLLKGIKIVPPYTSFHWASEKAEGRFEENPESPWKILPEDRGPSPDMLTDAFIESCKRIAIFEPRPVNLQSAGKDSRFILASWPKGYDPPCYTYGDGDSHEVHIAHAVAKRRGSRWVHVWLEGDDVAPDLGEVFSRTGLIVFPDRLLAARRIKEDGFSGVLDGYLGGVFNGAGYLDCDRYFSVLAKVSRFLTCYVDQKVSGIGRDRIAEAILDSILEVRDDSALLEYVDRGFLARLRAEWPNILDDLRLQVDRFAPANDSLATLWNNLVLANRSAHAIIQQKMITRSFVQVYCPFSGDVEFHRMQRRIPPREAAHDRCYLRMYRRFPDYASIPYGATLLPLSRPALMHKWSTILMSKGISLPFLAGKPNGRERDANSWGKWLRQSGPMRETALAFLREGGILDEENGARTFDAISGGSKQGIGKIFHLAGISKWIAISRRSEGRDTGRPAVLRPLSGVQGGPPPPLSRSCTVPSQAPH